MRSSAKLFAKMLSQALHTIKARHKGTRLGQLQDEIGFALGRDGGTAIEYWRKGHLPKPPDVEKLARELVKRGGFNQAEELQQFLTSTGYPHNALLQELLPLIGHHSTVTSAQIRTLSPFVVGRPITYPQQFFGRTEELDKIISLWRDYPLQNIAIIGPRSSGKTSLLHHFPHITNAKTTSNNQSRWLPDQHHFQWVTVKFRDVRMQNLTRLLTFILTELRLPIPDQCTLTNFIDVVLDKLRTPSIILMDDIEGGLAASELDQGFWWNLRALCNQHLQGGLAFVITATQSPRQLARECGKPSPFFNIFGYTLSLGPFREVEARQLINNSTRPFSEADVAWILEQSRGWPVIIQTLCQIRLLAWQHQETGNEWQSEGLRQIERFRYLFTWNVDDYYFC